MEGNERAALGAASPALAKREIARDRAARPEIARDRAVLRRLGMSRARRGGWVGSEGAEVISAVDRSVEAREPDLWAGPPKSFTLRC